MEPVIYIPSASDIKLGYLNISSTLFPFTLEHKKWVTAEHYVLAKQFEGTTLEELIRMTKNVTQARLLAKPRYVSVVDDTGCISKRKVYGKHGVWCTSRPGWETIKDEYLERALRAKFLQNRKASERLVRTDGMSIIDSKYSKVGPILENLRGEIIATKTKVKEPRKRTFSSPSSDIKNGVMSDIEGELIENFLKTIDLVKYTEGIAKQEGYEDEIFEDVFHIMYGYEDVENSNVAQSSELLELFQKWIVEYLSSWTNVTKTMPNFSKMVDSVNKLLFDKIKNSRTRLKVVFLACVTLRWLRHDATKIERETFLFRSKMIKKENIVFPPIRRNYRGSVSHISSVEEKNVANDSIDNLEILFQEHKLSSEELLEVQDYLNQKKKTRRRKWIEKFQKLDMARQKRKIKHVLRASRHANEEEKSKN